MKKVNLNRATIRTRFNRAREKKGSKYTFTNAIDGARAFTGVNKKHSTRGLNTVITEDDYKRELKEYEAEKLLKACGYTGEAAKEALASMGFKEREVERLLKAWDIPDDEQQQSDDEQQRKAPRLA